MPTGDNRIRLQRFLAQAGVAARRKAEQLITDGVVAVNGKVVTVLGTKVDPRRDRVTVNGQRVAPEPLFYAVLNKPKGCITAVSDPEGRPTVMAYVRTAPAHLAPVGRLDYYTEGVLLLTNDGELSAALQSPRTHVEKTYHVKLRGTIAENHIEQLRRGVRLDDGTVTRPAQVDRLASKSAHDWLVITLTEGKSRQIHRMAGALGYQVTKLQRVAFAGINFHGLRVGDARELAPEEVGSLCARVGLPRAGRTNGTGEWRARREELEGGRRSGRSKKSRRARKASARKPGLPETDKPTRGARVQDEEPWARKGRANSKLRKATASRTGASRAGGRGRGPRGRGRR